MNGYCCQVGQRAPTETLDLWRSWHLPRLVSEQPLYGWVGGCDGYRTGADVVDAEAQHVEYMLLRLPIGSCECNRYYILLNICASHMC